MRLITKALPLFIRSTEDSDLNSCELSKHVWASCPPTLPKLF